MPSPTPLYVPQRPMFTAILKKRALWKMMEKGAHFVESVRKEWEPSNMVIGNLPKLDRIGKALAICNSNGVRPIINYVSSNNRKLSDDLYYCDYWGFLLLLQWTLEWRRETWLLVILFKYCSLRHVMFSSMFLCSVILASTAVLKLLRGESILLFLTRKQFPCWNWHQALQELAEPKMYSWYKGVYRSAIWPHMHTLVDRPTSDLPFSTKYFSIQTHILIEPLWGLYLPQEDWHVSWSVGISWSKLSILHLFST